MKQREKGRHRESKRSKGKKRRKKGKGGKEEKEGGGGREGMREGGIKLYFGHEGVRSLSGVKASL